MNFLLLCSLLCVSYVEAANVRVDPLVLISQGLVRGQKSSDGDYSEFLGIPYAEVNASNPFGESLEHEGFGDSVFNAYDDSIKCPQASGTSVEGVLNCLTLNIYVPEGASTKNPMPVLVWIHGGGFSYGSASEYGPKYLIKHDLVVVAINYRLGPYGFFCLDTPNIPGNQGLKDQLTALRWIKSNIASFGGNAYNVTLAGQSAGSASAELQLYSSAEKLFHKVILQSAVSQSPGLFVEGDRDAAIKIAAYLGLNTTDTETAIEYLTTSSPTLVTAAANDLELVLVPCKEKSYSGVTNFITTDPYSMSNTKKVSNIPVLIGHTDREAQDVSDESDELFYDVLKANFELSEDILSTEAEIIRHFYIGDETISDSVRSSIEDFKTDFHFCHPTTRVVTKFLEQGAGPIYQYVFKYDTSGSGAGHGADLNFLFDMTTTTSTCCSTTADKTEEETLITDRMTTLWANFAKSGNPTPSSSDLIPVTWEAVSGDKRPYLVINSNLTIEYRVFKERMAVWDMFYSTYGEDNVLIKRCSL